MIPTKVRLASALEAAGLTHLAEAARRGEWDDYESESATPKIELVRALRLAPGQAAAELARRVMAGEFDNTKEEAEAWFEGRKLFGG